MNEKIVEQIIRDEFDITRKVLFGHPDDKRNSKENLARHVMMFCLHKILKMSQLQAADKMNYNGHAIVGYSCRKVEDLASWNTMVSSVIKKVEASV